MEIPLETAKYQVKQGDVISPNTDSKTERVNQTLEAFLQNFVNYNHDDWYNLLPFAEVAYNNAEAANTKTTSFFANHGFRPETSWTTAHNVKNPASTLYTHWMKSGTKYPRKPQANPSQYILLFRQETGDTTCPQSRTPGNSRRWKH